MEVTVKVAGVPELKQCIFTDKKETKLDIIRRQLIDDELAIPENFVFVTRGGNEVTKRQEERLTLDHISEKSSTTSQSTAEISVKSVKRLQNRYHGLIKSANTQTKKDDLVEPKNEVQVTKPESIQWTKSKGKMVITMENRQTIDLQVKRTDQIENVKRKIQEKTGITGDRQELICNGMPLQDQYDVRNLDPGSPIYLRQTIAIFIKTLIGKTLKFSNLTPSSTVERIKNLICHTEGIPTDQQRLCYDDISCPLKDGRSLMDYDIKHGSTLFLILKLAGS